MTKIEAIESMKAGHIVRHRHFAPNEWMTMSLAGDYFFEDGVTCSPDLFWKDRSTDDWNYDWEIVE